MNVESPFEFRALDIFLEAICSFLDARATDLEMAIYPALDELTNKVHKLIKRFPYFTILHQNMHLKRSGCVNKKSC